MQQRLSSSAQHPPHPPQILGGNTHTLVICTFKSQQYHLFLLLFHFNQPLCKPLKTLSSDQMQTLEHVREEGGGEETQWQRGGMIDCITFSRLGWRSAWSCRRSWRWWQRPVWLDSAVVLFLCKICTWKEECNTVTLFWPVTRAQGKYSMMVPRKFTQAFKPITQWNKLDTTGKN